MRDKIFNILKIWPALKLVSSHFASCQPASHSAESWPDFKYCKYFKYFKYFRDFGEHLVNDLLISLRKSNKTAAPEAPQVFKIYGFA